MKSARKRRPSQYEPLPGTACRDAPEAQCVDDTTYILLYALFGIRDGNMSGGAVKNALENVRRVYYGVVATYEKPFSAEDKDAITQNMLVMGMVKNGVVTFAYPEDAKRNLFVQRKQTAAAPPQPRPQ